MKMYERRIIGDQWPPGKSLKVRDQVNFFHLLLGTPLFETLTVLRVFSLVYDPIRNKTYVGMYLFAVLIIPLFVFCFPDLGAFQVSRTAFAYFGKPLAIHFRYV